MNKVETEAYERFRKVPKSVNDPSAFDSLRRFSKERFEAEHRALTTIDDAATPTYKALRALIERLPESKALRDALATARPKKSHSTIPRPATAVSLKSPIVRLVTLPVTIVEVPPFNTAT